ncbi:MAG: hypothetical protein GY874_17865 [Desulfobacteraceae bacterium]|nr:hypothetical protein [Desulfobacteraceae bacterium]
MAFDLLLELKATLEKGFEQAIFSSPADSGVKKPVNMFIGALPRNQSQTGDEFPYLIIRCDEGADNNLSAEISVEIIFASYCEDNEQAGYHEVQNMINRARRILLESPLQNSRYTRSLPVKWKIIHPDSNDPSFLPLYLGLMTTTWQSPAIEETFSFELKGETP